MTTGPLGHLPHRLDDAVIRTPLIEIAPDRALVRVPGTGRVVVGADGDQRRSAIGDDRELDFLAGAIDAIVELLNGRFSLRASVVSLEGRAVAVAGPGALGKSTIAAALARRGHDVVTDSVATITIESDGLPTVLPRASGLVLWPDSVERLGLDAAAGTVIRPGIGARQFSFPTVTAPVPLQGIVMLRDQRLTPNPVERLRGFDALESIAHRSWYPFATGPLGLATEAFTWATTIAATAPVIALRATREVQPDRLAECLLESIEATQ